MFVKENTNCHTQAKVTYLLDVPDSKSEIEESLGKAINKEKTLGLTITKLAMLGNEHAITFTDWIKNYLCPETNIINYDFYKSMKNEEEDLQILHDSRYLDIFRMIDQIMEEGEKKNLHELLEYCILQNRSGRIPHFLIVDYPDFEYIACLHTPKYKGQNVAQYIVKELGYKNVDDFKAEEKVYNVLNTNGNSYDQMLSLLRKENCFVINNYSISKKHYEIKATTIYDWEKLERKGSNINEFFEVISSFNT